MKISHVFIVMVLLSFFFSFFLSTAGQQVVHADDEASSSQTNSAQDSDAYAESGPKDKESSAETYDTAADTDKKKPAADAYATAANGDEKPTAYGDGETKVKGVGYDYTFLEDSSKENYQPAYGYRKYPSPYAKADDYEKAKSYGQESDKAGGKAHGYDFRGYPTPTGYINPNYQFPDRKDIDHDEKMDQAMRVFIHEHRESMEEVLKRFYPEQRDVFWQMDQVADPKTGELHPLNLDIRGVMGRNTWILWCGGNEWFWDWLATDGVGVLDFLHLLDSRQRSHRFAKTGLCNQPGMVTNVEPGPFGLYLDKVETPLTDRNGKKLGSRYKPWGDGRHQLVSDGVDPDVYGYPSGVIGLRLFPNPDFDADAKAKWDAHAFYNDRHYRSNPDLERPLKVGMSCAICHVAAHPLNPPVDPAEPRWDNLSAVIGNQYFRTSAVFGGQTTPTNFLKQFMMNQQPGTVDTSMTSTDWINNSNSMNAVFEFQARMHRALRNPAEEQPERALGLATPFGEGENPRRFPRVLMDGADSVGAWAALARVYLNIGLFGEQWNNCQDTVIGVPPRRPFQLDTLHTNSVYWNVNEAYRIHYMALYFDHRVVRDRAKGVVKVEPDAGHLYDPKLEFVESSTQAMRLKNALIPVDNKGDAIWGCSGSELGEHYPLDASRIADWVRFEETEIGKQHLGDRQQAIDRGREIFVENCMICHSSRQPEGFGLRFARKPPHGDDWTKATPHESGDLVLPCSFADWSAFLQSDAYKGYLKSAREFGAGEEGYFEKENFLSNELRIPVSLVGTNSQRALAENALEGEVWHDFSSDTYKNLKPVGGIHYVNAMTGEKAVFQPEGEGRGYYRPATLVSIWATAPFGHNNAIGMYVPDEHAAFRVSVEGRLAMFDDAIRKMLWKERRGQTESGDGGLRNPGDTTWRGGDNGWVWRTTVPSFLKIEASQIRGVVTRSGSNLGLPMGFLLYFVDHPWVAPLLAAIFVGLIAWKRRRWTAILAVVTGLVLLVLLIVVGLRHLIPFWGTIFALFIIAAGLVTLAGIRYRGVEKIKKMREQGKKITKKDLCLAHPAVAWIAPAVLWLTCLGLFVALYAGGPFLNGDVGDLRLGPFPKGTPVSAIMNMDVDASLFDLTAVSRGMLKSFRKVKGILNDPSLSASQAETQALQAFYDYAGPALLAVSKCPDWEMDRGHHFGEELTDVQKEQLIAFLKTL